MSDEHFLIDAAVRLARIPFALKARQPFVTPRKVLILQPCCVSQVMLTTPLLAALSRAYPNVQIDWAVNEWARPAVATNPRLTSTIRIGEKSVHVMSRQELAAVAKQLRAQAYDTCFIPNMSSRLAYVAWRAGIGQRVGLNANGHGFAHTVAIAPAAEQGSAAKQALALALAVGVSPEIVAEVGEEFYPSDRARTEVTRCLVEQVDWLGEVPLVVLHPGGGQNPLGGDGSQRWPTERFALLCNHLMREHHARVVLVGAEADLDLVSAVTGMVAGQVVNLAGQLSLSEIGALCEMASLYVGNDTGPTHIAAAVGCKTLAIYGPTQPFVSQPFVPGGNVVLLWRDWREESGGSRPFAWSLGISVKEAIRAADRLLLER